MRKTLFFLALAGIATTAPSQEIYKYVAMDGGIVYTDNPGALANGGQKVETAPMAGEPGPAARAATTAGSSVRLARLRRISGVTPLAHERNGKHLTPAYWQRQRELTQALVAARSGNLQANAESVTRP